MSSVRCDYCQKLFNTLRSSIPRHQRDSYATKETRRAPTAKELREALAALRGGEVPIRLKKANHAPAPARPHTVTHPKRTEAYRLLREAMADEQYTAEGYVYLISDGTAYKIGQSALHPQTRLKGLQTGNPRLLTLVNYREVSDRHAEEARLHVKFIKHNLLGEWFKPSTDIYREFDA